MTSTTYVEADFVLDWNINMKVYRQILEIDTLVLRS